MQTDTHTDSTRANNARATARALLANPHTNEERRARLTHALRNDGPEYCYNPNIDTAREIARLTRNIKLGKADIKRTQRDLQGPMRWQLRQLCEDNITRALIAIDNMNQALELLKNK